MDLKLRSLVSFSKNWWTMKSYEGKQNILTLLLLPLALLYWVPRFLGWHQAGELIPGILVVCMLVVFWVRIRIWQDWRIKLKYESEPLLSKRR